MTPTDEKKSGRVCLIGAGPGDPGLITARGLDLLRRADVVVHDALVLPSLLREARADAEVIDVGKRRSDHKLSQDQINALLVEKARQGLLVARLKGGDPFIFGRGAEEAGHLAARGIACEIVPGVTAGIAAPAAAGIPLTHRLVASTVTFITGHEDESKADPVVDYAALAKLIAARGTLVIYMGIVRLETIAAKLLNAGVASTTPAAVIQWGATPRQRSGVTTLDRLPALVAKKHLWAPAVIVIGEVVGEGAIGEAGKHLDFYTQRPLFGQRIVITRTREQASELRVKLEELGAEVLEAPTIRIAQPSPEESAKIDAALMRLANFHWLVLTSANGVQTLASRLDALKLDARSLAGVRIAAIGDATADALKKHVGVRAALVPRTFVAESLAEDLIASENARGGIAGKRFLLLRADIARKALPQLLTKAGASVEEFAIYLTAPVASLPHAVLDALREGKVDWVTFTSSSTARNLVALLDRNADNAPQSAEVAPQRPAMAIAGRSALTCAKLASIGPITTQTLRDLGLPPTVEATVSNIDGLIAAMVAHRPGGGVVR